MTLFWYLQIFSYLLPEIPYGIDSWKDQITSAQSTEKDLRDLAIGDIHYRFLKWNKDIESHLEVLVNKFIFHIYVIK